MIARCPKCGCFDIHNSRPRGSTESFFRVFGIAPQRCSACGWRAVRPKWLYPPRPPKHHSSTPSVTTPSPLTPNNQQQTNSLSHPAQTHPILESQEQPQRSHHHRTSSRRHSSKGHRIRQQSRYGILLAAILLGMGTGLLFYFCIAPASLSRMLFLE